MIHIAEAEGKIYDRSYQVNLLDKIRYPDWSNTSQTHWTYSVNKKAREIWHHLDDMAKLTVYLVLLEEGG